MSTLKPWPRSITTDVCIGMAKIRPCPYGAIYAMDLDYRLSIFNLERRIEPITRVIHPPREHCVEQKTHSSCIVSSIPQ
jgi:hypothetical protein